MVQIGRGYILGKIYGLGFFIKVLFPLIINMIIIYNKIY
jgi:hypothetical protein